MQQQMMQQHPMMAYANHPGNVTTDLIQQYLDENKQLILAILDNQNSGKLDECAVNQAKLQRNLMYLAAIADSQPQMPPVAQQFPQNPLMQSSSRYMQQPAQQMTSAQPLMTSRSPMLYAQSSFSAMQHHQQQQDLHSQLGIGGSSELHMLSGAGIFSDFSRSGSAAKEMGGSAGPSEGRGGDGSEPMYLKSGSDEGK